MPLTPWLSHFKTDFELARRRRQESIAFDAMRCEAFDRFLLLGCPTQADEEWCFTDITPIAETNFTLGAAPSAAGREAMAAYPFHGVSDVELVFVNGYFVPEASKIDGLPEGTLAVPLKSFLPPDAEGPGAFFAQIARIDRLPFVALNTALFEDGACIVVPPRTLLDKPIHIRFICNGEADARPAMSQPRALIMVGDGGAATIVESYAGPAGVQYFTNAVTEVVLGARARLTHYKLQRESAAACHISVSHVASSSHSTYRGECINGGAKLARTETHVFLAGEHAQCTVGASSVANADALVNVHTVVDHALPYCVSRQRCRWMLAETAVGVVTGKCLVRPEAKQARVKHVSRAWLQSAEARVEVKPTFDILASDATFTQHSHVKRCSETERGPSVEDLLREVPFARCARSG